MNEEKKDSINSRPRVIIEKDPSKVKRFRCIDIPCVAFFVTMLVFTGNTNRAAMQECFDRIGRDSNHQRFSTNTNCHHVHR